MLKRLFSLTASLCVRTFDVIGELVGLASRRCVVLEYHSVMPEFRERFAEQMDDVIRRATPIRADVRRLPERPGDYVIVTFDDGLESVIENALPELKKRGIPATVFIVTEMLGVPPRWKNLVGAYATHENTMSQHQLEQLPPDLVTIGSHSMNHPFLPSIDKEQLRQELVGSRVKLEQLLKRDVRLFSCPYGAYNPTVVDTCREAGYERVFTGLPMSALREPNEFVTGRFRVHETDWPLEFRLRLAGAYRWLPTAIAWKRCIFSTFRKAETAVQVPKGSNLSQKRS